MGAEVLRLFHDRGRVSWLRQYRKFWRHELVRLKYHNPAVPMTVDRTAAQTDQAIMTVFFSPSDAQQTSSSPTGAPAPTSSTSGDKAPSDYVPADRIETIQMSNRIPTEILSDLVRLTKARVVEPSLQEQEELRTLDEHRIRSERDSKLSLEVRQKKKREEAILAQARGEIAASEA